MTTRHLSKHIFSASEISEVYKAIDIHFRSDILEQINKYHFWYYDCFSINEITKIIWCADYRPISMFLTNQGKSYDLDHVANRYIDFFDDLRAEFPWFVEKVEAISANMRNYATPPLIVSTCRFRQRYYLIDGFHRGISMLINDKRGIGDQKHINVYVGYNPGVSVIKEAISS